MLLSLPVETIAGTKLKLIETLTIPYGKGEGQLNNAIAIDIDKTRGEMYISDFGGLRGETYQYIQKFTTKGEYVGIPAFMCPLYDKEYPLYANDLFTIDASGNLYLIAQQDCYSGCPSIFKYSSRSNYDEVNNTCFFSIKTTVDIGPVGPDGCVYTWDVEDNTAILKFTPNDLPTKWDNTQLEHPTDMEGDADGYVYVLDFHYSDYTYRILKYTADGELLGFFTLTQTSGYDSMTVYRIAIDSKGNIYAYDEYSHRIQVYNPEGALMTVYVIDRLFRDIAVDGEDVVYFLDPGTGENDPATISKFTLEDAGKLVVNTTGDESDANKGDGVCDVDLSEDGDQCTLRAAIEEVNLNTDVDTITFDIPTTDYGYSSNTGTVTFTISPKKPLPNIEKAVVIDATSQSNGTVVLNGKNAGKACGISTKDKDCTIKGMHIQNFSGDGIKAKSDVFLKNTKISSNKGSGVSSRTDITIEGTDNEFSDNGKSGISSGGDVDADVIQVENNGGYGIYAKGDVSINAVTQYEGGPKIALYTDTSTIGNNGKDGISAKKSGLGLGGAVDAFYLDVVNNHGVGIRAESDLTMDSGKICDNAKGNLVVGGSKNLTNVTVCESVLSAPTQGNAMPDTEIPDNGNGCRDFDAL